MYFFDQNFQILFFDQNFQIFDFENFLKKYFFGVEKKVEYNFDVKMCDLSIYELFRTIPGLFDEVRNLFPGRYGWKKDQNLLWMTDSRTEDRPLAPSRNRTKNQ